MAEILFNEELNNYTLQEMVGKTKSIKRIPIKFKLVDKTSRFRKEILKSQVL